MAVNGGWALKIPAKNGRHGDPAGGGELRNSSNPPPPIPKKVSARLRLSTIGDCKREIAKLYREVRRGEMSSVEAGKLVWMLNVLANLIADYDLEARIAQLEHTR